MSIEWRYSDSPVPYQEAMLTMDCIVQQVIAGTHPGCVWFLEHPPLYTAGTSAISTDLLHPERFPVYQSGRGGQYTYHGPGQRIIYVMLDLKRYAKQDVRHFVHLLEQWIINSLNQLGIKGERRSDRIGVWVKTGNSEAKIAALGIRLKKWVSYHGIALNVCPDLEHFSGINPCGITQYGVTSLEHLGITPTLPALDNILKKEFEVLFS